MVKQAIIYRDERHALFIRRKVAKFIGDSQVEFAIAGMANNLNYANDRHPGHRLSSVFWGSDRQTRGALQAYYRCAMAWPHFRSHCRNRQARFKLRSLEQQGCWPGGWRFGIPVFDHADSVAKVESTVAAISYELRRSWQ